MGAGGEDEEDEMKLITERKTTCETLHYHPNCGGNPVCVYSEGLNQGKDPGADNDLRCFNDLLFGDSGRFGDYGGPEWRQAVQAGLRTGQAGWLEALVVDG
ncbi:hypothetical protein NQZ68_021945 [Dissostichus eleginoides]|nr:hypothetical protein NQZ68_021945 [Dissostichus eleginoides]